MRRRAVILGGSRRRAKSYAWGLLLADVARHAANAYANEGSDPMVVLARIREMFDAEMFEPTDVLEEIS